MMTYEELLNTLGLNGTVETITGVSATCCIEDKKEYDKMYKAPIYSVYTIPLIKDVIFNDPATIVIWADGSKTIVKVMEGDTFDPHTGLAQAISKKALGDDYRKEFKKWTKTFKGTRKHRKILEMREKFEAGKVKRTKPITLIDAIELLKVNWERVKSDLIRKGVIG